MPRVLETSELNALRVIAELPCSTLDLVVTRDEGQWEKEAS